MLRRASAWSTALRRKRALRLSRLASRRIFGLRRIAESNLRTIAPELSPAENGRFVDRHFDHLGEALSEAVAAWSAGRAAMRMPNPTPRYELFPEARSLLDEALLEGRGVVLPSAHLANWEAVARTLHDAGYPFVTLVRGAYDRRLDSEVFAPLREGISTISRGEPGAAAAVVRALKRGSILGAPMDLASRVPSISVPFFGRKTPFPRGPATLALRRQAPIVVATWEERERNGGVVEGVSAERIIVPNPSVYSVTAAIAAALERRIRRAPERWLLVHSRW